MYVLSIFYFILFFFIGWGGGGTGGEGGGRGKLSFLLSASSVLILVPLL